MTDEALRMCCAGIACKEQRTLIVVAARRVTRVNLKGKHFHVAHAGLSLPPYQRRVPLWFGGSSPAAHEVAAKHIDTCLPWGETPSQAETKIREVKHLAARYHRADKISFGIRLYVIVRETEAEAWAAAQNLYDHMDKAAIAGAQAYVANIDSVGQQRMSALHGGRKPKDLRELEIEPNLWAGIGLVRHGPGTALIGSADQVVAKIQQYRDASIEVLILSGCRCWRRRIVSPNFCCRACQWTALRMTASPRPGLRTVTRPTRRRADEICRYGA